MADDVHAILRSLEIQNESKAQEIAIANQKIEKLQMQLADSQGLDANPDESEFDFIKKIADSKSKFSKEAQDILDRIGGDSIA
jgi:hypothetical protein